jgi:hypothetical protein
MPRAVRCILSGCTHHLTPCNRIADSSVADHLCRKGSWTESVAAGSEKFVREIASKTEKRKRLEWQSTRMDPGTYAESLPLTPVGSEKPLIARL